MQLHDDYITKQWVAHALGYVQVVLIDSDRLFFLSGHSVDATVLTPKVGAWVRGYGVRLRFLVFVLTVHNDSVIFFGRLDNLSAEHDRGFDLAFVGAPIATTGVALLKLVACVRAYDVLKFFFRAGVAVVRVTLRHLVDGRVTVTTKLSDRQCVEPSRLRQVFTVLVCL